MSSATSASACSTARRGASTNPVWMSVQRGPEALAVLGDQEWAGRGCSAGGLTVASRLSGRSAVRCGRQFPVRMPVLGHGGAAPTLLGGGEVLTTEFIVGGVMALDIGHCGTLG
jgi:hypothetical protein